MNKNSAVAAALIVLISSLFLQGAQETGQAIPVVSPLEPVSPVDGAILAGPMIDILWPNIPRVGRYHLQIAKDADFLDLIVDRIDPAAASFRTPPLAPGFYWLRARVVTESGQEGVFGASRKFQVIPLPDAPKLSEADIKRKTVLFTCRDLGEGIVYRFQLSFDDRFGTIMEELLSRKPEIAFTKPSEPGVYYARTAAVSGEGIEGPFSEARSFRIVRGGILRFICLIPAAILLIVLLV